jgi:DNA-binding transcriptional regulator YdaS (Cro superfamily)
MLCGMDPLARAIHIFGSQLELAKAVGLTSAMAVSQWRVRGVPPQRARDIERATGGAVTVHDLRPDIFGPAPGVPPEPQAAANDEAGQAAA